MRKRDGIKRLEDLCKVDARHALFAYIDRQTGQHRPFTLEDHYADIERYALHEKVPDDVATQYDVARNLYLYAWFEYRFFNVAEASALSTLELAMKKRIGDKELKQYIKQRNVEHKQRTGKRGGLRSGMKTLMEYCRDKELVCNEGFTRWHQQTTRKAYWKAEQEQRQWAIDEMKRTNTSEISLPKIDITALAPSDDYNHVQHLIDHCNKMRNNYAHGSTMLYNDVLYTFEMTSEFINQLFSSRKT